jgi:hypothetical protein
MTTRATEKTTRRATNDPPKLMTTRATTRATTKTTRATTTTMTMTTRATEKTTRRAIRLVDDRTIIIYFIFLYNLKIFVHKKVKFL